MRSTSRILIALALALALLAAACGNDDNGSPAAETATATTGLADAYRDEVVAIVTRSDEARGAFRGASSAPELEKAARELALTARAAADDVDKLSPPASHAALGRELAEKYRLWAAKLEAELARTPVSTERLGDVIRTYGKLVDGVYEDILIAE